MSFLYPWFLLAMLAVSIPVLIHLFHFRRYRKVYFSNIRFLAQLQDQTRKQSRLKHLVVLALRVLAIVCLVLAFARPYLPPQNPFAPITSDFRVSIYLDNSFSMEAQAAEGTLFELAKKKVREIVAAYPLNARFQLLSNHWSQDFHGFVDGTELLQMLEDIRIGPWVRTLNEITQRQSELLSSEPGLLNRHVFVVSDFQKTMVETEGIKPDSLIQAYWLPLTGALSENVFIDSIWLSSPLKLPGQTLEMGIRINNQRSSPVENMVVRLYLDQQQRGQANVTVDAASFADIWMSFRPGAYPVQQGFFEIDDYPIRFDDRLYFSFNLISHLRVMVINHQELNPYLHALFARDSLFVFRNVWDWQLDLSEMAAQDLIILHELPQISSGLEAGLMHFVRQGGSLLVLPPREMDQARYNAFLLAMGMEGFAGKDTSATLVTKLHATHPLFAGVFEKSPENIDLPNVQQHYIIRRYAQSRLQTIMGLQNGRDFLASQSFGSGRIYLSAVPLHNTFSNWQRHALFVPIVYNMALHKHTPEPVYYTLGQQQSLTLPAVTHRDEQLYYIRNESVEIIPEKHFSEGFLRLFWHDQLEADGNYLLYRDQALLRGLAFNFDRSESFPECFSPVELRAIASAGQLTAFTIISDQDIAFDKQLEQLNRGLQLWRWFLMLALLMLLLETILLRFWK